MTKGALYYHFASKEELLLAIVAPLVEALTTFVEAVREAGTVSPASSGNSSTSWTRTRR